jgi:uncharacterized protein YndB with AHSA1/START domain
MTNALTIKTEPGQSFIEFAREFDAPVEAVFRAHAEPDLIKQWLGPRGYDTEVEQYDFRTGGSYRYLQRDGDNVYAFHGVFHVVRENDFAVQTFEYEGFPDVVSLDSMHFEDLGGGRTRLSGRSVFSSLEAAEGMIASGMEAGMAEGYERLDELLAKS